MNSIKTSPVGEFEGDFVGETVGSPDGDNVGSHVGSFNNRTVYMNDVRIQMYWPFFNRFLTHQYR